MRRVLVPKIDPNEIHIDSCKEDEAYAYVNDDSVYTLKFSEANGWWYFRSHDGSWFIGPCFFISKKFQDSIKKACDEGHEVYHFESQCEFENWITEIIKENG